jgi:hypothetical protein
MSMPIKKVQLQGVKKKKIKSAANMESLGEKVKSITISVSLNNNNNNSVKSRGYHEVLSSSSSDEEEQKN